MQKRQQRRVFKRVLKSPFSYDWPLLKEDEEKHIVGLLKSGFQQSGRDQVCLGINNVTKHMEKLVKQRIESTMDMVDIKLIVFVCVNDLPSIAPVEHVPVMANIIGAETYVISFRKGTEGILAKELNLNHLSMFIPLDLPWMKPIIEYITACAKPVQLPFTVDPTRMIYYPEQTYEVETTCKRIKHCIKE